MSTEKMIKGEKKKRKIKKKMERERKLEKIVMILKLMESGFFKRKESKLPLISTSVHSS
jgi:hypothetical protein